MRVAVERSALQKALTHVHRVVERRNTIPILANVLLRADGQTLTLRATDLDLEVTEAVPAEISDRGATTVPALMLYEIVRKLPDGSQVSLARGPDDTTAVLQCGRARFTLQALPEADFPDLTAGEMSHNFTLPASALKRLIEKTGFAISTEETRYYLNGIYLHLASDKAPRAVATDGHRLAQVDVDAPGGEDGMPGVDDSDKALRAVATDDHRLAQVDADAPGGEDGMPGVDDSDKALRAVATDGHRLAQVDVDAPGGADGMPSVIVPRKTVQELDRLLVDLDSEVAVALSENKIRFTVGPVVLTSKLIDGTFPDYARVIPSGNDKVLHVNAKSFQRAVDLVSTVSSERGRAVKLSIADGRVVFTVNNPDSGTATEEIDASYGSEAIDIGFNARYLLDIADQLETEDALFKFSDPGAPTLVRDKEDNGALFVLMPMRV